MNFKQWEKEVYRLMGSNNKDGCFHCMMDLNDYIGTEIYQTHKKLRKQTIENWEQLLRDITSKYERFK